VVGGYSFGGQVAFETALRLAAAGADVRALVIIDTVPAWDLPRAAARVWAQVSGASPLRRVRGAADGVSPARSPVATDRFVRVTSRAAWRHAVRKAQLVTAGLVPRQGLEQYDLFFELHSASALRYRPSHRFVGPAIVVRFTGPDRVGRGAPDDLGWSAWVDGPVTVVKLRGKHLEMLRPPDVGELGAQLRVALGGVA